MRGTHLIKSEVARVLRRLRQSPRFSFAVIASVAFACGAILVAFGVFEAAFLREVAVKRDVRKLVAIRSMRRSARSGGVSVKGLSFPDYEDLRRVLPRSGWQEMTAWSIWDVTRETVHGDQPLRIAAIAGDYFRLSNAHFVHGYGFDEHQISVVITRALWRELAADGGTSDLTIYGQRYPVTGVVDDGFRGIDPNDGVDAWIPMSAIPHVEADPGLLTYHELENLVVLCETSGAARARALGPVVATVSERLQAFHSDDRSAWHLEISRVQPTFLDVLRTPAGQAALAPLVVLLCVLLIAATNVANLFVIRAAGRQREFQIRLSLGLSRQRLLRYECLEPAALGVIGLGIGVWIGTAALQYCSTLSIVSHLRLQTGIGPVLAATGAAVLFVGICALAPAVQLRGLREADIVHQGQGITAHGVSRLQRTYLILQFTFALAFACVAVQLASGVRQQSNVNVGFDTKNLVVVTGLHGDPNRPLSQEFDDYSRLAAAVGSLPSVVAVTGSVSEFFGGYRMPVRPMSTIPMNLELQPHQGFDAAMDVVAPGYFAALGLPVRNGREFDAEDRIGMPTRIIVNQTFARRIARDRLPIGMTVYEFGRNPLEIIGVVPDIRATAADVVQPVYYRSLSQSPLPAFVMYVRVRTPSAALESAVAATTARVLPASGGRLQFHTAEYQRTQRDLPAVAMLWLSAGLAAIALIIAGLGLYGVASFATLARQREHGIRAAIGATPRHLATMVLTEGLEWTAIAAAASLPFVWVGARVAMALVAGVRTIPGLTAVTVGGFYFVVVLVALGLPARRASIVSPADALRSL